MAAPAAGGEARPVTRLAGGASWVAAAAAASERVVITADLLPSADTLERDAQLRAERTTRKVSALLHDRYPVRYWDHDLGPGEPHLLAIDLAGLADTLPALAAEPDAAAADADAPTPYPATLPRPRDLTPRPGRTADTAGVALTPDGRTLVASLRVPQGRNAR